MGDRSKTVDPRSQPWLDWAGAQPWGAGSGEAGRMEAVAAALAALDQGMNSVVAALAADLAAGWWTIHQLQALAAERGRADAARAELATVKPAGGLTDVALGELLTLLQARLDFLQALQATAQELAARQFATSRAPLGSPGRSSADTAAPARPAPPRPTLQEFLSENGILVLSYLGAFLLIVATVIFEVSGAASSDGGLRLAAVLFLNVVFAAAGAACLRLPQFRFVGRSYVALAALMAPLSVLASYVFVLRSVGIQPEQAVLAASIACTVLYGALAMALDSRAYAWLSLGAIAVAGVALVQVDQAGSWAGAQLTLVPLVYVAVAAYRGDEKFRRLFGQAAAIRLHTSSAVALVVALGGAASLDSVPPGAAIVAVTLAVLTLGYLVHSIDRRQGWCTTLALAGAGLAWAALLNVVDLKAWQGPPEAALAAGYLWLGLHPELVDRARLPRPVRAGWLVHSAAALALAGAVAFAPTSDARWPVAATFAAATAVYLGAYSIRRTSVTAAAVALGVSATALTASLALTLDAAGFAAVLVALGAAYVAAGRSILSAGWLRAFFRFGGATQVVAATAMPVGPDWLHALLLVTVAALVVAIAIDAREPLWLHLGGAIFAWAWYWLAKAVIPPPPNPGPDTLVLIYSPLPVVFAAVAALVRRRAGRRWSHPLLILAAAGALAVAAGGLSQQSYQLLGIDLLVYALVSYVAALRERWVWVFPVAVAGSAGGVAALLHAAAAPDWSYPPAIDAVALATFAGAVYWRALGHGGWGVMHAYSALALAATVALALFGATGFTDAGNAGGLAGIGAVVTLALLLYLEGRRRRDPTYEYSGLVVLPVVAFWGAHYLGLTSLEATLAPSGLGALAAGLAIPHDPRAGSLRQWAMPLAGAGLVVVLGTTAWLSLDVDVVAAGYVALLAVECVAAVVLGVGLRSRTLVVGGSSGIAVASLRALAILSHQYPLWVVFGAVALLLLGVSAALAILRERFGDIRSSVAVSWSSWS